MNAVIQLKRAIPLVVVSLLFAYFAFSPTAQATPDPTSVGGALNTADGLNAMPSMNAGTGNSAFGAFALFSAVSENVNTAVGLGALINDRTEGTESGDGNTAVGAFALFSNTTSKGNTAVGVAALLRNNVFGRSGNTAVGAQALQESTDGRGDTAVGALALNSMTGDNDTQNTAVGAQAMENATSGSENTAVGADALSTATGTANTAIGKAAMTNATSGSENTAVGAQALFNATGNTNTALGASALYNLGQPPPTCSPSPGCTPSPTPIPGHGNIAVGYQAGSALITGSNNIYIANPGVAEESNTIRIGTTFQPSPTPGAGQNRTFIAGIKDATLPMGTAVVIDTATGQLGIQSSSARFKEQIRPMDKASEAILALKPVSFRYRKGIDPLGVPQFGLVAEQVEKVNRDLVVHDQDGKPYTVRYEAVNAMLLNEFLKEHKQVEQQHTVISQLESKVAKQEANAARQQKQIETLTAGLQRVSARVEVNKPAPQVVVNEP